MHVGILLTGGVDVDDDEDVGDGFSDLFSLLGDSTEFKRFQPLLLRHDVPLFMPAVTVVVVVLVVTATKEADGGDGGDGGDGSDGIDDIPVADFVVTIPAVVGELLVGVVVSLFEDIFISSSF